MSAQRSFTAAVPPRLRAIDEELVRASDAEGLRARWLDRALFGPVRELLARPGKSIRARLVAWGWRAANGEGEPPQALCDLVELLHAGSLVIDDVEDDATTRRDGPALHRVHGVPLAINAGNWLYFWALAQIDALDVPPHVAARIHRACTRTLLRCHYGQALDLSVRIDDVPQGDVVPIVEAATRAKTGELFALAASLGAIVLDAPPKLQSALFELGEELGVVLQMLDDLRGVTTAPSKGREDVRGGRVTWLWAWIAESLDADAYDRLRGLAVDVARRRTTEDRLLDALRARLPIETHHAPRLRANAAMLRICRIFPSIDVDPLVQEIDRMERADG